MVSIKSGAEPSDANNFPVGLEIENKTIKLFISSRAKIIQK